MFGLPIKSSKSSPARKSPPDIAFAVLMWSKQEGDLVFLAPRQAVLFTSMYLDLRGTILSASSEAASAINILNRLRHDGVERGER